MCVFFYNNTSSINWWWRTGKWHQKGEEISAVMRVKQVTLWAVAQERLLDGAGLVVVVLLSSNMRPAGLAVASPALRVWHTASRLLLCSCGWSTSVFCTACIFSGSNTMQSTRQNNQNALVIQESESEFPCSRTDTRHTVQSCLSSLVLSCMHSGSIISRWEAFECETGTKIRCDQSLAQVCALQNKADDYKLCSTYKGVEKRRLQVILEIWTNSLE